jgi:hypothetical protein
MHQSWSKAVDLKHWADTAEARLKLPALVRRLISATTEGQQIFRFPADEGVQRPGWDGELMITQGNAWVPTGESVWEMSVGASPASKADENYNKRTKAADPAMAAKRTFVFVTPLTWTGKLPWIEERKRDRVWRDVRVMDGDDLEQWLEIAPSVDLWMARLLGKVPAGMCDLSRQWERIAALTTPPLPAAAFFAGRDQAQKELQQALGGPPREIAVAALSAMEVIDFIAAMFGALEEQDPVPARGVLVETLEAWNHLADNRGALILLPAPGLAVERTAVAQAIKAGHHVVTHRPYTSQSEQNTIRLPRAWRHELEQSLVKAGFSEVKAARWSRESGGCLEVLQRLASPLIGTSVPAWAQPSDAASMLPFILCGAWNDANPADRAAITQLSGHSYDEALAVATSWLIRPETPFHRTGTQWTFISREDTWIHLAPQLSRALLDSFAQTAAVVLGEDDPRFDLEPDQRPFAVLRGKMPRHSAELREGVAETLALLGADLVSLPALPSGAGPGYATRIVRGLLSSNEPEHRWFSLAPILGLLAEAAPEEFLDSIQADVDKPKPALASIFKSDGTGLFSGSWHYRLMWPLGALAWHPAYLSRVALILARLAEFDPGGNTHPRPAGVLHDIFRLWFPQTAADAEQRFQVLDLLIERFPHRAWKLLLALLPKVHDSATLTPPPRWREWPAAKTQNVTPKEHAEQANRVAERLQRLAVADQDLLLDLVNDFEHLPPKVFFAMTAHLREMDLHALPLARRFDLWKKLHERLRHHEHFTKAQWRMSPAYLTEFRTVVERLTPPSAADRSKWLFDNFHIYMGGQDVPFEEQEKLASEQRRQALAEIHSEGGLSAIAAFAATASLPWLVGQVLGESELCPDVSAVLPTYLDGGNVMFAQGYVSATVSAKGWEWAEAQPFGDWSVQAATAFIMVLRFGPRAWALAKSVGEEVWKEYWTRVTPRTHGLTVEDAATTVSELLKHNRPLDAVDYAPLVYYSKLTLSGTLLVEILERSIEPLNQAARSGRDVSNLAHDINQTLVHLQEAPDADPVKVARIEWTYLPLLQHGAASPKFLHRELGRDPEFFAQCISLVYRKTGTPTDGPTTDSENSAARRRLALDLLESWESHPLLWSAGGPDGAGLLAWVESARQHCTAAGRLDAGDNVIGKLLSTAPSEFDGSWPCLCVRDIIERIPGEVILDGFSVGIFNGRGPTTRGMHEGGAQERDLAKKYHGYADACQMRWPRVAGTLRKLARSYESDARFMDDRADEYL